YFFERGLSVLQKSQEGLLRSILHQAIRNKPDLAPIITGKSMGATPGWYRSRMKDGWTWPDLTTAFKNLLERKPADLKLCLFVDRPDEYRTLRQSLQIAALIEKAAKASNVKLCISSRPLLIFQDAFETFPHIKLPQLTYQDILVYMNVRLGNDKKMIRLKNAHPDGGLALGKEIVDKASGVFLWVKIIANILLRGILKRDRVKDLQRKLRDIPEEL
ncbi:uncharacterized protein BDR25DRAFT_204327, partial [Lindgomyces ingoldianus]